MCNISLQGWKGMPSMNFKTCCKCQKLTDRIWKTTKIWYIYSLIFLSLAQANRDIKEALWKKKKTKKQGNKIKDSGEAYDIN